jgi:hypothetical protein
MFKRFTERQKQKCLEQSLATLGVVFVVSLIVGIVGAVSGNPLMIGVGIGIASMIAVVGIGVRENNLAGG